MDDGFNPTQVEQLRSILRDEVGPIVHEAVQVEVATQLQPIRQELRTIIREEVRAEVATQLKPLHDELHEFRVEAREDADALNSVVMEHDKDMKAIKRHVGMPIAA